MRQDVATYRKHLVGLENLARTVSERAQPGDETVARLAEYLVVRLSGFIEVSIRAILSDYVAHSAKKQEVAAFVESRLGKDYNLNEERIRQIVGSFSPEWAQKTRESLSGPLKESIDSVVSVRNALVHGDQVSVSLKTAIDDYHYVLVAMQNVAAICNPTAQQWFT